MMDINQLYQQCFFSRIDRQFAQLMTRYVDQDGAIIELAAALVSRSAAQGNVCLDLNQALSIDCPNDDESEAPAQQVDPSKWADALRRSPVVGQPGDFKPMVLDKCRLYLHRHWQYEQDVAEAIKQRCRLIHNADDEQGLAGKVALFFPEGDLRQRQALLSALTRRFTVISGGPGTGKTYTIAKLILMMRQLYRDSNLRLKLAAPTGKAAMRLQQTIESSMRAIEQDQAGFQLADDDIQTLHRLLGARADRSGFKYHAGHNLPVDVVIVDEASMIDLALMAALTAAIPTNARLVLIGDKNQLASVEAGAVLGDICSGLDDDGKAEAIHGNQDPKNDNALWKHIVVLKQGYRFATQSGIDDVAAAVNSGDTKRVRSLIKRKTVADVVFKKIEDPKALQKAIETLATEAIVPQFEAHDPDKALGRMPHLMILSPLRNGPFGMAAINGYVEQVLRKHQLLHPWRSGEDEWYAGRPIMVTRNDYHHNLFNGDLGVAIVDDQRPDPTLSVCFSDGRGGHIKIPAQQLSSYQTAFAMTVHKSQGSEFDRVVLVLPDRESPLLTRELVYTAITRARRSVEIWGTTQRLNQAIRQRIQRSSGLAELLWSHSSKQKK